MPITVYNQQAPLQAAPLADFVEHPRYIGTRCGAQIILTLTKMGFVSPKKSPTGTNPEKTNAPKGMKKGRCSAVSSSAFT